METLREVSARFRVDSYYIKHNVQRPMLRNALQNYLRSPVSVINTTSILLINMQKRKLIKYVKEMVRKYNPMYIWIMEGYKTYELDYYYSIPSDPLHCNTLLIRQDIYRNRCISRIPFGLKVDSLSFRYISPNTRSPCELSENEFGDFNIRSNLWINFSDFCAENRNGIPGGLGFTSNMTSNFYFLDFPSDHDACLIDLNGAPRIKKQVDHAKLLNAINEAMQGRVEEDIYKRNMRKNPQKKLKIIKQSDKIVNPNAENLDMKDWKELYGHDEEKLPNTNHICRINEKAFKMISSKATDINDIPIKEVIKLLSQASIDQTNKFLKNFRWTKFNSRVVCLRKKDKVPNCVKNLRPIQISPVTFKIAEQSRSALKNWLNMKTSPKCFAFKPKSQIVDLLTWLKSKIVN